jgi:hypothetical protein
VKLYNGTPAGYSILLYQPILSAEKCNKSHKVLSPAFLTPDNNSLKWSKKYYVYIAINRVAGILCENQ